jgi:hypothetical protein
VRLALTRQDDTPRGGRAPPALAVTYGSTWSFFLLVPFPASWSNMFAKI